MQKKRYLGVYCMALVVLLMVACKKEKSYSTIRMDSTLLLEVKVKPGEHIIPFQQDTIGFVGLPGAIGVYKKYTELPFLILGRELDTESEFLCHFVGSIEIITERKKRIYGIALPVDKEYRTVQVDSYNDLTLKMPALKLWLKDYFSLAYETEHVQAVSWTNEITILRMLNKVEN